MKVFYTGFNLYHQFTNASSIIKNFTEFTIDRHIQAIEVSHTYNVLLVADGILLQGLKNDKIELKSKIGQVCCNEDIILLLDTNGDVFKTLRQPIQFQKLPMQNLENNERIARINCEGKMAIALTNTGRVYNYPNKLDFVNKNIVDIKVGRLHCLLLDRNGDVYSFGAGSHGQLGHGSLEEEMEPRLVDALAGIKMVAVAAGGWHSAAVSRDGDLYVWGWNSNGQLGLAGNGAVSVMATPQVVDFGLNIAKVACGNRHTVVLLDNGQVWGCGWNKFNQLLDSGKLENLVSLTFLRDFSGERVEELKCGPWSSLVICE